MRTQLKEISWKKQHSVQPEEDRCILFLSPNLILEDRMGEEKSKVQKRIHQHSQQNLLRTKRRGLFGSNMCCCCLSQNLLGPDMQFVRLLPSETDMETEDSIVAVG
ncbi:hypothetical protein AMECASPLE_023124 [Ameca splendens]|uniref:Uncharacterized protein n=1 Tax=Ameca splendens TaxID=208324 RepID=A0ABV0XSW5_9TELE